MGFEVQDFRALRYDSQCIMQQILWLILSCRDLSIDDSCFSDTPGIHSPNKHDPV